MGIKDLSGGEVASIGMKQIKCWTKGSKLMSSRERFLNLQLAPSCVSRDDNCVVDPRQSRAVEAACCCRRESNPTRPPVGRQLWRLMDAVQVCHTAGACHATHALDPRWETR